MSKKKKNASRRNGKKGKGPTSQSGKIISSLNALKHGGNSPYLLPHEDPVEYGHFREKVFREWEPATGFEEILVGEIAFDCWRLLRLARYEIGLTEDPPEGMDRAMWADEFRKLTNLRIRIERVRDKKRAELKELQLERRRATSQEMTVQEYRQHQVNRNLIRPSVKFNGAYMLPLQEEGGFGEGMPPMYAPPEPMEEANGPYGSAHPMDDAF